jgi:hypothetical protein
MIYRKQGHVVRWENGTLIRVTESGAAREEADFFECWPQVWSAAAPAAALDRGSVALPSWAEAGAFAWRAAAGPAALRTERLILTTGYAEHEYGDQRWSEHAQRLHASVTHGQLRALVDQATFDTTLLERIGGALQRAEQERAAPRHLRLAPNVTAALLPYLPGATQTAGGIDGYGNPVTETSVNFYRPSYRVRPVRMPFNLRLEHGVTSVDEDLPRAIALLAPVDGPLLRVLIEEKACVYPATIHVDKIEAVAEERVWYPYGAGSFGAEMML